MSKLFRIVLAAALIMLLLIGLDAVLDYERGGYEPRAFRAIRSIVDTFADRPLGLPGLTFWLLIAGGSAVLSIIPALGARRKRIAGEGDSEAPAASPSAAAPATRRRQIGPASAVTEEPADSPGAEDFAALFNLDKTIEPTPAWRLVETSPASATSWLGGLPHAAGDFTWPASADGRPMLFLAQLGLAGVSAPGLPADGALLVFVGAPSDAGWDYHTRTIAQADIAAGAPVAAPAGAVTPGEVGWNQHAGATLPPVPLRLEAYLDTESDAPVSKLFGVEVQDAYGFPYPEGYRNLLYIEHHARLGTASEHWQGMSIACPAAELAQGAVNGGRIFGTHNG